MKSKFFGLKMAVAVLAVGATFTSCYDSNQGDIYIPDEVVIPEFPDPVYVVNGTVTNFQSGAAVDLATVYDTNDAVFSTVVAGYFEEQFTKPQVEVLTFKAEGFYDALRTVAQSTLQKGQGTLVSTLNVAMSPEGYIPGGIQVADETAAAPATAMAKEAAAAALAAIKDFENLTGEDKEVEFSPKDDLGLSLDFGAVVPATAVDAKQLFTDYVKIVWGNDPYVGYGVYEGKLKVKVPAHTRIKALTITPLKKNMTIKFTDPENNTPFSQKVDVIEEYNYFCVYAVLDHVHGHEHGHSHGEGNAGGGIGE